MPSTSPLRVRLAELLTIDSRDEDVQRRGRALLVVLFTTCGSMIFVSLLGLSFAPVDRRVPTLVVGVVLSLIGIVCARLARRGRVDLGGLLLSGALSLLIAAYLLHVGAYTPFVWFMSLSVVIASITVRPRLIWVTAGVNFAVLGALALLLPLSVDDKVGATAVLAALLLPITVFTYYSAARTQAIFGAQAAAMGALERAKAELDEALTIAEEHRDRADAANRAKSTFLANMSHELRTPLNAIIGYAELLAEESPAGAADDLRKIQQAGRHLLAILSDILDLSRIEAGKMALHVDQVDLHGLVGELRGIITPAVTRRGNTFVIDHDPACALLHSDPLRLRQILVNLLANAAKFTADGRITLRIAAVAEGVRFEVVDTGIGMDAAALARAFDDFTQADDSSTRRYGGAGLGLSLSRRLARLLGATLTATSEPLRGSTFTLTVPALPP